MGEVEEADQGREGVVAGVVRVVLVRIRWEPVHIRHVKAEDPLAEKRIGNQNLLVQCRVLVEGAQFPASCLGSTVSIELRNRSLNES